MVSPMTTRVIFPDSYDETRATPYPMVMRSGRSEVAWIRGPIVITLRQNIAREGMVMALRDLEYHNKNDCIIVDLCSTRTRG